MGLTQEEQTRLREEASRIRREYRDLSASSPDFTKRKNALQARYREIERLLAPANTTTSHRSEAAGGSATGKPPPLPSQLPRGSGNYNPGELPAVPKDTKIKIDLRALSIILVVLFVAVLVAMIVGLHDLATTTKDHDDWASERNRFTSPSEAPLATESSTLTTPLVTNGRVATSPSEAAWNIADSNPDTNGNIALAVSFLLSLGRDGIKDMAVKENLEQVAKATWRHYGKVFRIAGNVNFVHEYTSRFSDGSNPQGTYAQLNVRSEPDETSLVLFVLGDTGDAQKGSHIEACAFPVGSITLTNILGGEVTQPLFFGYLYDTRDTVVGGDIGSLTVYSVGQTVKLSSLDFQVTGCWELGYLNATSQYSNPTFARAGTKFVVIGMSLVNTSRAEFDFSPDYGGLSKDEHVFRLIDNQGREYKTYDDSIGHLPDYLNQRDLAPSIPESGYIAYEVPTDCTGYKLVVNKTIAVALTG